MLFEGLAAATGMELAKFVGKQVLDLGTDALKDYVKDFFKGTIEDGVVRLHPDTFKVAMAGAVKAFMEQFAAELDDFDVEPTTLQHFYQPALKKFVKDAAVRPVLGSAFQRNCKRIDAVALEDSWAAYQPEGTAFPAKFDWEGIAKQYAREVKAIVKADSELGRVLSLELDEERNELLERMAGVSPGFRLGEYRECLRKNYGYLKLNTLDSTDQQYRMALWSMFIEQNVREALPPSQYELPRDIRQKLVAEKRLGEDLSEERLEQYRQVYLEKPIRGALEAIENAQHSVIVGDPGSGKSTLVQYLAMQWVEGKAEALPLLIELRDYATAKDAHSFLEFLESSRPGVWKFEQGLLDKHLREQPTLVMFDGLDEVFDRASYDAVLDEIIRFTQIYPKARVLVTTRVIGYNPEQLQQAEFRQFTLQSLDDKQIETFIELWYDLAVLEEAERIRLKQQLSSAIGESPSIRNLADNPLLLTMMAILNRRRSLPRVRDKLYRDASLVLLHNWDVDYKRLKLPVDAIVEHEKQAMRRRIAYEMQAGKHGLKGNLIDETRLKRVITDYLRELDYSEPREKAVLILRQLRERNHILCFRGAETYSFVHRTFLEYFCASDFVHKFEKQQSLSFKELRDETFGKHWQDKDWHEVLRLITSELDVSYSAQIIDFLINEEGDISRINLAINCLSEVKNRKRKEIKSVDDTLFNIAKGLTTEGRKWSRARAVRTLAKVWRDREELFPYFKEKMKGEHPVVYRALLEQISLLHKDKDDILACYELDFIHLQEPRD